MIGTTTKDLLDEQATEIERLKAIIHRAERELENILVSTTKVHPDKLVNPTLKELRSVNEQLPEVT